MEKASILERLEMLESLCIQTEPDVPDDKQLFTEQSISVQGMIKSVRDLHTGKQQLSDQDSERDIIINIMRQSNRIWRLRNKIKNGEKKDLSYIKIHETIEDYISHGQKINAIKYYRREMDAVFDEHVSLREAKEYIDNMAINMKLRGIIN